MGCGQWRGEHGDPGKQKSLGARVLAAAGSDEKLKRAIALGADAGLNHSTQDIPREACRLTEGQGVDVVFEHVGEATWERSLRALRRGGRLVTCGATTGNRGKVNLDALFWNNTHILGNRVGSKGDLLEALRFCTTGQLRPVPPTYLSPGQSGAGTPALRGARAIWQSCAPAVKKAHTQPYVMLPDAYSSHFLYAVFSSSHACWRISSTTPGVVSHDGCTIV